MIGLNHLLEALCVKFAFCYPLYIFRLKILPQNAMWRELIFETRVNHITFLSCYLPYYYAKIMQIFL